MGAGYELARAVEQCIASGHHPAEAWGYTPRQLMAWGDLRDRRRKGERASLMHSMRVAQAADESYKKIARKLIEESE